MERLLYLIAKAIITVLQRLSLRTVARIGRVGGGLVHFFDARHRRVSRNNLRLAFPEKPESEIRSISKENFKRIGENFACVVKTASLEKEEIQEILEIKGIEKLPVPPAGLKSKSIIFATGHFGNFELYARCNLFVPGDVQFATTYRGLKQKSLNDLVQSLRTKSGCLFFERRTDLEKLKEAMNAGGLMLGFLADQYGGIKGMCVPLMGNDCSTGVAPALFALRYNHPLFTCVCYRVTLGKWRIEVGDEIPTHENGVARTTEAIMTDVNRAFDAAIRRDPANWFWVHNRWKRDGLWWKKKPAELTK
jgi:lauroyl/myristoyl acyltransferase